MSFSEARQTKLTNRVWRNSFGSCRRADWLAAWLNAPRRAA
jgi:hypothetical protein